MLSVHSKIFQMQARKLKSTPGLLICLTDNDIKELPTPAHQVAFELVVQLHLVPLKRGWHILGSWNSQTLHPIWMWMPSNESWQSTHYVHVHDITIIGICFSKRVKEKRKKTTATCVSVQIYKALTLWSATGLLSYWGFQRFHFSHQWIPLPVDCVLSWSKNSPTVASCTLPHCHTVNDPFFHKCLWGQVAKPVIDFTHLWQ